jgi:hypothetical protein
LRWYHEENNRCGKIFKQCVVIFSTKKKKKKKRYLSIFTSILQKRKKTHSVQWTIGNYFRQYKRLDSIYFVKYNLLRVSAGVSIRCLYALTH